MTTCDLTQALKISSDVEFFTNLEKYVKFDIPVIIKNILMLNGYNTAIALSTFDENSTREIQDFMRNELIQEIVVMLGIGRPRST